MEDMRRPNEKERQTVETMIALYCRGKEGNRSLCPHCAELARYAARRLERCRFGERKPACRRCPVHCYRPDMRRQMIEVMRYAGPRMPLRHPVMALRHLLKDLFRRRPSI